jgi:hypothetical protein
MKAPLHVDPPEGESRIGEQAYTREERRGRSEHPKRRRIQERVIQHPTGNHAKKHATYYGEASLSPTRTERDGRAWLPTQRGFTPSQPTNEETSLTDQKTSLDSIRTKKVQFLIRYPNQKYHTSHTNPKS